MLTQLTVKNIAIVEQVSAAFGQGLNIVTGETGAGKSVLMGALSLVLGERADHDSVRSGASEASVMATFSLGDTRAIDAILDDAGLPPCEDGSLIIRRTIGATAGGRCYVNDSPLTLQTLRRIGEQLVDMHGAYDHQSLFSSAFQRDLLDSFGGHAKARADYSAAWAALGKLRDEQNELSNAGDISFEVERLQYEVNEIESAAVTEADGDELRARHAEASAAKSIIENATAVVTALDDGEDSAFDRIAAVHKLLADLARDLPDAKEWLEESAAISAQLQELSRTISARVTRIDADGGLLAQLDERITLMQKLRRKYGETPEAILSSLAEKKSRLDALLSRSRRLEELETEISAARKNLEVYAATLRAAREKAGEKLAREVTRELRDLGFAQSFFGVKITPTAPASHGADAIDFTFAPNPGEPANALRAIASSGEIARVMLATKTVLAAHDKIPLLVFDEVDANIGGAVGAAIGRKLRTLARTHQVISITHLPQVAAFGAKHFAVSKSVDEGRTRAVIRELSPDGRVAELARMLGGMSAPSLAHARAMLDETEKSAAN